ncbi:hypothetical protein AABB24_021488 [Solanum stoloniferum]|uniref:Late blight resistance protein n=1 Tax=Solanum stoloniferum TaxID=62892 RepID=A0ABD2SW08_9SOLN
MDTKRNLWDYTKEKYIIPEVAYNWTTVTIQEAWRRHRSDLKMTYYDPYDNDEVQMAKRPGHIQECQFRELLKYWKFEKFKDQLLRRHCYQRKKSSFATQLLNKTCCRK